LEKKKASFNSMPPKVFHKETTASNLNFLTPHLNENTVCRPAIGNEPKKRDEAII
jgi:hypothetical protein